MELNLNFGTERSEVPKAVPITYLLNYCNSDDDHITAGNQSCAPFQKSS